MILSETQEGQKQGANQSQPEESYHCSTLRPSPEPTFPDLLINSLLSNWEKTKLCSEANNGHWYRKENDMENMRVLEQVASNPSWASQGLSVPKATQQRDPQSNLLQSLL